MAGLENRNASLETAAEVYREGSSWQESLGVAAKAERKSSHCIGNNFTSSQQMETLLWARTLSIRAKNFSGHQRLTSCL